MPEPTQKFENWRGMLWALFAVLTASAMSIAVRGASLEIDSRLIVFHRFTLGFVILLGVMLLFPTQRRGLKFSDPKLHIIRGILIGVSTLLGFYALATRRAVTKRTMCLFWSLLRPRPAT